jgi:heptosyltransferase-3
MLNAVNFNLIKRILVTKLRHHGDVLLSSPVFQAIKNHYPHIEIDALVYADTQDMLTLHPSISKVYTIDRAWKKLGALGQLKQELALIQRLKQQHYDVLIHLTEHWRGAWLKRVCNIPVATTEVVQSRNAFWNNSFTHHVQLPRAGGRHIVESNLDHLRVLGLFPSSADRALVLVAGAEADHRVQQHLDKAGLSYKSVIQIHPGSRWSFKCWPVEKMAALINQLHASGHIVVLTGSPSNVELDMVQQIQAGLKQSVALNLCGQLSLKELAALSAKAALFIGVDSAPMHIAAAVKTPTVALFGPSGPTQWGQWGTPARGKHTVIQNKTLGCVPCGRDGCGGSKVSDCLVSLDVDVVLEAVIEQMDLIEQPDIAKH